MGFRGFRFRVQGNKVQGLGFPGLGFRGVRLRVHFFLGGGVKGLSLAIYGSYLLSDRWIPRILTVGFPKS